MTPIRSRFVDTSKPRGQADIHWRKRSVLCWEGKRWRNSYSSINIDTQTKATNFAYTPVTDFLVSGGKRYYRALTEAHGYDA